MHSFQENEVVVITKGLYKGEKAIIMKDVPMHLSFAPIKLIKNEKEHMCDLSFLKSVEISGLKRDYDTLINLALETNDERWFIELIVKKHVQEMMS